MSKQRNFFGNVLAVFSAATAVAAAAEGGRRARDRDLRTLGIDPAQFNNINR